MEARSCSGFLGYNPTVYTKRMNKKKLVVFDMDDTLISSNTWLNFNTFMGLSPEEDYELYLQFSRKEITYKQWTDLLVQKYTQKPTTAEVEEALSDFTLNVGAKEAVKAAQSVGCTTVLLTGSFKHTADMVAKLLGIDYVYANTQCTYDENGIYSGFISGGDEKTAKLILLQEHCATHNLKITDCVTVGDGANDIPLFLETKCGVTFEESSAEAKNAAHFLINDLTELPDVLVRLI